MGDEKSNDVAGVEADDALPAPRTEPASVKAEHHGHKSAAATRDLESAAEEANTAKKQSRLAIPSSSSSSRLQSVN